MRVDGWLLLMENGTTRERDAHLAARSQIRYRYRGARTINGPVHFVQSHECSIKTLSELQIHSFSWSTRQSRLLFPGSKEI